MHGSSSEHGRPSGSEPRSCCCWGLPRSGFDDPTRRATAIGLITAALAGYFISSREFPYIWEDMVQPISYTADRQRAEQILLEDAERHTIQYIQLDTDAIEEMRPRYFMRSADLRH
jgi:hypothetical protein